MVKKNTTPPLIMSAWDTPRLILQQFFAQPVPIRR